MSQEEELKLDQLFSRIEKLVRFAYFIGAAIFMLGLWVAGQQFTDQYQWDVINRHSNELDARGEWMKSVDTRLTRIETQNESIKETLNKIEEKL